MARIALLQPLYCLSNWSFENGNTSEWCANDIVDWMFELFISNRGISSSIVISHKTSEYSASPYVRSVFPSQMLVMRSFGVIILNKLLNKHRFAGDLGEHVTV